MLQNNLDQAQGIVFQYENILNDIPLKSLDFDYLKLTNQSDTKYPANKNGIKSTNKYSITDPNDLNKEPKMTVKIDNEKEQRVFLYVDAGNAKRAVYTILNEKGEQIDRSDRELSTGRSILDLGSVPSGAEITLELKLTRKGEYEKTYRTTGTVEVYAASFNKDVFEKAHKQLSETPMIISEYGDDFINASIDAKENGFLYTSIPYDDGWTVKVDGEKVETIPFASDGFLGIDISKGNHTIEFSYYPIGFNLGICVTIASVIGFGIYIFIMNRSKKKNNTQETSSEPLEENL